MNTGAYDTTNGTRWGAGVYYGVTALVVIVLAAAVISGKFFYARKRRREVIARHDVERRAQEARGEAPGLPTYNEPGVTIPMPTLSYPQAAYRPNEAHPDAQHDAALPGYDIPAPPKYDFASQQQQEASGAASLAVPATTNATPSQRPTLFQRLSNASTRSLRYAYQPQQEMQQASNGGQRVYTPAASPAPVEEGVGQLHSVSLEDNARSHQ